MQSGKQLRENTGGNFCGHLPHAPDFSIKRPVKEGQGGYPRILTKLMNRVTDYYASPRMKIPSLDQANGSVRQQRTERREACLRLLIAIIKHVDLSSLRIGQPTSNGFISYDIKYLASEARIGHRRAERAAADLAAAGLLSVSYKQPRVINEDGEYRGLAKPRLVSPLLFALFGLGEWLRFERKRKSATLKHRAEELSKSGRKVTRTQMTKFTLFAKGLGEKLSKAPAKQKKPTLHQGVDEAERHRQFVVLCGEIKQAYPSMTYEQIKTKAKAIQSRSVQLIA